jgi:hypothetical protein
MQDRSSGSIESAGKMSWLVLKPQCTPLAQNGRVEPSKLGRQFGSTRVADGTILQLSPDQLDHLRVDCVHAAPFCTVIVG